MSTSNMYSCEINRNMYNNILLKLTQSYKYEYHTASNIFINELLKK